MAGIMAAALVVAKVTMAQGRGDEVETATPAPR
jgi:hypothetical protein